jgi:hypothetical protein
MAKTDAGGDFTLHYVPAGTYDLVIEVAGAASASLSVQVTKKTVTDLEVIRVDCTPACTQEVCDGLDNNCNGVVDEGGVCDTGVCGNSAAESGEACDGPDLRGQSCTSFSGFTGGTLACSPSCQFDFSACTGCIPTPEVCDGLDNNCNGVVDEGFNLSSDPFNCGGCGNVCPDGPSGTKACMAGSCIVN